MSEDPELETQNRVMFAWSKVDPFVKTQNGPKIKSDPPFLDEMVMDRRRCS